MVPHGKSVLAVELRTCPAEVSAAPGDRFAAAVFGREGRAVVRCLRVFKIAATDPRLKWQLLHERRGRDTKLGSE